MWALSPVLCCSDSGPFWIAVTRFDQTQRPTTYKIEGMGDDRIEAILGSREFDDRALRQHQINRLGTIVARVIGRQSDAFFDHRVENRADNMKISLLGPSLKSNMRTPLPVSTCRGWSLYWLATPLNTTWLG